METQAESFDVILKWRGSGRTPNVANIDQFRVAPETIETCRHWLASQGVEFHGTDFGLACRAEKGVFERLFDTELRPGTKGPGRPAWQCATDPKPPREIGAYVEQVSVAASPELF